MRAAFLLLLAAFGAAADPLRGSLTAGFGVGRDLAGVELELGAGNWSGFASITPTAMLDSSIAFGGRWSMRPDGSGLGVALQTLVARPSSLIGARETYIVASATVHWRWIFFGHLSLDVGAGPAVSFDSYRDVGEADSRLHQTNCFCIGMDVGSCDAIPLDVEAGLGVAF